ncbi:MAG: N-acetyl-gamma-glutamyl-phosphate reductase [Myxococcota bacterium]|jgi:N-acetyl-gamma-glutamyl-phosphate reductase
MTESTAESTAASTAKRYRAGVVGASGYTGVELLRIVHQHPNLDLTWLAAGRAAGQPLIQSWPALQGIPGLDGMTLERLDVARAAACCDVVFLALPHGVSAGVAPDLLDAGVIVVDLGADFRLRDPASYARYYGAEHPCPERLPEAVYGLVELNRVALRGARLIANPGCYPTATALAATPLIEAGLAQPWLVADCLSGVSGAGRKASTRNLFCEVAESAGPYALGGTHRHVPEIEQTLGVQVTFTPHLVPMIRGMIATVHARLQTPISADALRARFAARYADEAMVVVRDEPPTTGDVLGCNRAHVYATFDAERGVATAVCAIDNVVKGAAGQAVQALNVALGLDEGAGLPIFPVLP